MERREPTADGGSTVKACPVEDCFRSAERWPTGPQLCIPCREHWAADHQDQLTHQEHRAWVSRNIQTAPNGERYTTWPKNFGDPRRELLRGGRP